MWQFPLGASIPAYGVQIVAVGSTRFAEVYGFLPTYEVLDNNAGVPNMINYTTWSNNPSPAINLANTNDQVLLLNRRIVAQGPPQQVLNTARLLETFGITLQGIQHDDHHDFVIGEMPHGHEHGHEHDHDHRH